MSGFWTDIEAAILAWAQGHSGLPAGHVLWANQRKANPVRPYATLKRISIRRIDGPGAEVVCEDDGQGGAVHKVTGRNEFTVSLQVFSSAVVGDGQRTVTSLAGERTAADYMHELELAISKPSVIDSFSAVNLAAIDVGTIQDLPDDKAGTWMSRAQMDVIFSCTRTLTDAAFNIEHVQGEVETDDGESIPFAADLQLL